MARRIVFKAHLSPQQWEQIANDQYAVSERYYEELSTFGEPKRVRQIPVIEFGEVVLSPAKPPKPKLPHKLCDLMGRFAVELFNCEIRQYPRENRSEWGLELIGKTLETVGGHITKIEANLEPGMYHHASFEELMHASHKALEGRLKEVVRGKSEELPINTASEKSVAASRPRSVSDRLDEAAKDISHEEQADRIGMGRTTYFEVKAGRGGKKARKKVEDYLSRLGL